ncbi:hypothetical protein ACWPKO_11680 [Coraliomargarita sp. W4R53]
MKSSIKRIQGLLRISLIGLSALLIQPQTFAQSGNVPASEVALKAKLERLTQELHATKQALALSEQQRKAAETNLEAQEIKYANAADLGPSKITPGDLIPALEGLKIGGAVRVNYAIGDYGDKTGGPSKADGDGGNFSLDTFRINADYSRGAWQGKFEYRFFDGYHFLHTGWLGYNFEDEGQLQVGVNRVPFGAGAYGTSQSWFFDQHYYLGLSDDMDLGIKYTGKAGALTYDLAYYYSDEGTWAGDSKDSSRYSYDVVDETGDGYEERNQFNARAIYATQIGEVSVDLGASAQYGMLESNGSQDDGDHYALSFHPVFKWSNWTLSTQLTYYKYDVDADQPLGTDKLVQFGAYDFPTTIAAEAWVPSVSLSYYYEVTRVDWLDYVIPYIEYSSIMKTESDFNDSEFVTVGAAWARGNWFIYTEIATSNGNDFVGGENGYDSRFGSNPNDDWQSRFNVNFGYYF